MILALTEFNDSTAMAVAGHLRSRGEEVVVFPTRLFPQEVRVTLSAGPMQRCGQLLNVAGCSRDLEHVSSVWYRAVLPPEESPELSPEDRDFVHRESAHVIRTLWQLLADRFWINPWARMVCAESKPFQLAIASRVGLEIPASLVTNDPDHAISFFDSMGGRVIYKALTPYEKFSPTRVGGISKMIFTNPVARADLVESAGSVRMGPCLFQELVEKEFELRVVVVGRRLFTAAIDSQTVAGARYDWRHATDGPPASRKFNLPPAVAEKLLALMEHLGLEFGCVDMIVTPSGHYVFLEVNANGQWFWIEEETGMPICEAVAESLFSASTLI
ncbi:MAG: MvdC/MvdD family ATP grasp protein [Terriglobales bacterium]